METKVERVNPPECLSVWFVVTRFNGSWLTSTGAFFMSSQPTLPAEPQEFNVVLEPVQMSAEAWKDFINRLMIKQSMRRGPTQLKSFTISTSDEPDFFIVDETKG
jgi:hypothetical protein